MKLVNADTVELGESVPVGQGRTTIGIRIDSLHLNPGRYAVGLWIGRSRGACDSITSKRRSHSRSACLVPRDSASRLKPWCRAPSPCCLRPRVRARAGHAHERDVAGLRHHAVLRRRKDFRVGHRERLRTEAQAPGRAARAVASDHAWGDHPRRRSQPRSQRPLHHRPGDGAGPVRGGKSRCGRTARRPSAMRSVSTPRAAIARVMAR